MSSSNNHDFSHLESDCYYQNLKCTRDSDASEIKRAYRKLSLKWHPDKNRSHPKAETYFKVISEAYQVLSDPNARKLYDLYGKEGIEENEQYQQQSSARQSRRQHHPFATSSPFPDFHFQSPEELFRQFFGDDGGFGNSSSFGRQRRTNQHRGGSSSRMDDMFTSFFGDDPFFSNTNSSSHFQSSFFSDSPFSGSSMMSGSSFGNMGGGGGSSMSSSSTTTTRDRRGNTITRTVTRSTGPDGITRESTEEFVNGKLQNLSTSNSAIQDGFSQNPYHLEF